MRRWLGLVLLVVGCSGDDSDGRLTTAPPSNDPPIITSQPDTTMAVGDTLRLRARAMDPNGDPVTFQLAIELTFDELQDGYTADVVFFNATGEYRFVPGSDDVPSRSFRFFAYDGRGGEAEERFTVFSQ